MLRGWAASPSVIPAADNAFYLGSATRGYIGVHFYDDFLLKRAAANTLALYNSAASAYRNFVAGTLYYTAAIRPYSGDVPIRTVDGVTRRIPFQGYGSGSYVEHAALDPNNLTLTNGLLLGALAGGGQSLLNMNLLELDEITTPSALVDHAKLYAKADNKLYFQDGAGVEHEVAFV